MLKFASNLSNTKLVLVRRHILNGSCSAVIVMRPPPHLNGEARRNKHQTATIPDCPTPPPPKKSNKLFYFVVGATIFTGAAVTYAKSTPEVRNWLESNAPWANDFVALVYQENTTYWKFSVAQFNSLTTWLGNFIFGKEGVSPMDFKQRPEQDLEKDAEKAYTKKHYELPPVKFEPLYVEEKPICVEPTNVPALVVQSDKCTPATTPPVKITKTMVEVEHDLHENTKVAIDNYKEAVQHCKAYNKALFKVVEASVGDLDKKMFSSLQGASSGRATALEKAKNASTKAKCAMDTLEGMIRAGVAAPPDTVAQTLRYIKDFRHDLEAIEDEYKAEEEKSVLSKKYWNKVEAARAAYREELQALFPGVDLSACKLTLKGDTDLLLIYTLKQIQFLQNELAEIQTVRDKKINHAIECHDQKEIIEAKVEDMIKAERVQRELEYQKKALSQLAEANKRLKEQLMKQVELQQAVQAAALAAREKQLLSKYDRAVSEALEKDRIQFKKDLATMAGKMMAIENTLKQRAKAEAEARRSQSLWAAAEALLAATRRTGSKVNVGNELKALEKAGAGDKLVESVVKSIPNEVREAGVITEKALRDKFDVLEKTAAKVALIGKEGAALPVYFLSWLQSKILFQKLAEIPEDELNNQPTDFSKLDTFDIINRAKYHMEHGDLAAALRYVNLLQGGPRAAALPWLEAAKRHLEVRQAAEAVMAHASVSGLLYL